MWLCGIYKKKKKEKAQTEQVVTQNAGHASPFPLGAGRRSLRAYLGAFACISASNSGWCDKLQLNMPSEVTVKTLIEASVNVTCGTQKERQHVPCFTGLDPDSHTSQLAAEKLPSQRLPWLLLLSWILTKVDKKSNFTLNPAQSRPSLAACAAPREMLFTKQDEPSHRWYEAWDWGCQPTLA